MSTSSLVDSPVGIHGLHLRPHDAMDLDGYREFSLEGVVNNIEKHGITSKGTLKVWHASRLESTSFDEVSGASLDFTADGRAYLYVKEFARFVAVTFEWDEDAGGNCDLAAYIVPKR